MRWIISVLVVAGMFQWCFTVYTISYSDTIRFGTIHNYIYYKQKITWAQARWVCQSIGGDLAKIDSAEDRDDIVSLFTKYYGIEIFTDEYWVSLVNQVPGEYRWLFDCSNLTFTSNFPDPWNGNDFCFRVKHTYHNSERKRCDSNEGFMCQVKTDRPCHFIQRITGDLMYGGQGMNTCENRCVNNTTCWAAIRIAPDNCVHLGKPGYGVVEDGFRLSSRLCVNVTVNLTTSFPPTGLSNAPPNATCAISPVANTTVNDTINELNYTIEPTPCETVNVTVNVTVSSVATQTATSVSTITLTTTEYVTTTITNITEEEASRIADEYVRNLTMNAKQTSKYTRKLNSSDDRRSSSMVVGFFGVIFVATPFAIIFLTDIKTLVSFFIANRH